MINVSSFFRDKPSNWDKDKTVNEKSNCSLCEKEDLKSNDHSVTYLCSNEQHSTFTPNEYDRSDMKVPFYEGDNSIKEKDDKISNMKIMIIEDDDYKYNKLIEALNKVLDNPKITRAKSRNGGLREIKQCYQTNDYFDLIFCDNYMPLFDDDSQIKPFASNIINYIRRTISKDLQICIYSSEEIDSYDYDFFIKFDNNLSLKAFIDDLKQIFSIVKQSKKSLSKQR